MWDFGRRSLRKLRRFLAEIRVHGNFFFFLWELRLLSFSLWELCLRVISWGRKRWKTNGEKMVDFWCRSFSRFTQSFSRFIRDINGEKKHLVIDDLFSRLVFHGLPPLDHIQGCPRTVWGELQVQCAMSALRTHGTRPRDGRNPNVEVSRRNSFCSQGRRRS